MSRYKGLFTFDVDNHRYIPVEQADGIISDKYYHSNISLCENCYCMTHTLAGDICGKCKKPKHSIKEVMDERVNYQSF